MSHEARVFAIQSLARQIEVERTKLFGQKPDLTSVEGLALVRKIESWEQTLKNMQRDLKSQSHFNHMLHQQERFGAHAYAASQRLGSKEANVAHLAAALKQVGAQLAGLSAAFYAGPGPEERALKGLETALSNWKDIRDADAAMDKLSAQVENAYREVQITLPREAKPDLPPGPGPVNLMIVIMSLLVLLKALHKK